MSLASHIKNLGKIAPVGLEDWVGVEEQQLQRRPRKRAGHCGRTGWELTATR